MVKSNLKKIFITVSLFLFCLIKISNAATLFTEINNVNVQVGDVVTATVYVNADGEPINNVEGLINVSSDVLEVQSVSSSGSILNLWVEQPTYANSSVTFNGGVTTPGYSGNSGKVITIFMKARKSGSANISFQSASVRANDGLGTDVLKSKSGSTITVSSNVVVPAVVTPEVIPVVNPNLPKAPNVESSLTPDSDKWYKTDTTTFSWNLPSDVIAVKTLLGKYPDSEPTVLYQPPINKKTLENLTDGVWYFHLRYQNSSGWGQTLHKKIQIDNTDPVETEISYKNTENGLIEISFAGSDKSSTISKFIISTEGKEPIEVNNVDKDGKATYVFNSDYSGIKDLKISAYDSAGNYSDSYIEINFPIIERVEPIVQEKIEESTVQQDYLILGNKVISILSIVVPILAILLLFFAFVYLIVKRFFNEERTREKRLEKIEKDAMQMINTLKENIKEDIHLFKVDKSIHHLEDAENILLSNLLMDIKHIEKVLSTKIRKNKNCKKNPERVDD